MRNHNEAIAFLLLSLAVVNTPQTMVLCVGSDGHVAVEPAWHNHRAECSHACNAGSTSLQSKDHSHVDHQHAWPCTDIPIPVAASEECIAAKRWESGQTCVAVLKPAIPTLDAFDVPGTGLYAFARLLPSQSDVLRCVILQV